MSGARAAAEAVAARQRDPIRVWSLQEIHETGVGSQGPGVRGQGSGVGAPQP